MTIGITPEQFYLDESAPDDRVVLQCEVMNSERFVDMRYTEEGRPRGMRQAYSIMTHTGGATAVAVLKHYLDAPSWDNLCAILSEYSESVVELSAYECAVGVLGWNTIFWEIRNY